MHILTFTPQELSSHLPSSSQHKLGPTSTHVLYLALHQSFKRDDLFRMLRLNGQLSSPFFSFLLSLSSLSFFLSPFSSLLSSLLSSLSFLLSPFFSLLSSLSFFSLFLLSPFLSLLSSLSFFLSPFFSLFHYDFSPTGLLKLVCEKTEKDEEPSLQPK